MRNCMVLLVVLVLAGCTYEGKNLQSYLEHPTSLLRDPHFSEYKLNRDNLESLYLKKEITYAQYLEEKIKLDDKYAQEVHERNKKIRSE